MKEEIIDRLVRDAALGSINVADYIYVNPKRPMNDFLEDPRRLMGYTCLEDEESFDFNAYNASPEATIAIIAEGGKCNVNIPLGLEPMVDMLNAFATDAVYDKSKPIISELSALTFDLIGDQAFLRDFLSQLDDVISDVQRVTLLPFKSNKGNMFDPHKTISKAISLLGEVSASYWIHHEEGYDKLTANPPYINYVTRTSGIFAAYRYNVVAKYFGFKELFTGVPEWVGEVIDEDLEEIEELIDSLRFYISDLGAERIREVIERTKKMYKDDE